MQTTLVGIIWKVELDTDDKNFNKWELDTILDHEDDIVNVAIAQMASDWPHFDTMETDYQIALVETDPHEFGEPLKAMLSADFVNGPYEGKIVTEVRVFVTRGMQRM